MALPDILEANSNNEELNVKIISDPFLDVEDTNGASKILSTESYDIFNAFQNLDSYSKSLALLKCLSNFDSSRSAQEDRLTSASTNSDRETPANLTEFYGSSIASVNSVCSRDVSPISFVTRERVNGDLQQSTSPKCYLSPATPTRSLIEMDLVGKNSQDTNQADSAVDEISCTTSQDNLNLRRDSTSTEDTDQIVRELDIWGPPEEEEERNNDTYEQFYPNFDHLRTNSDLGNVSEPRLARIYSAAALFRRPSATWNKHTRPPMSKLFISLDVTVEMFLKLQGAAKRYMLDERYPERRNAVGTKCQAENEHKKLKLFSLVKCFLEEEGWGERCFGSRAEGADQRKLKWPESKNLIIKRVTPLMRRMVTNEWQRLYANERRLEKRTGKPQDRNSCRKSTSSQAKRIEGEIDAHSSDSLTTQTADGPPQPQLAQDSLLDLSPNRVQESVDNENLPPISQLHADRNITNNVESEQLLVSEKKQTRYYINFLKNYRRVKERLVISLNDCLKFSELIRHMYQSIDQFQEEISSVKVHGPDGLIRVYDENSWSRAILLIFKHEWMDQEIRCLVNLETSIQKVNH